MPRRLLLFMGLTAVILTACAPAATPAPMATGTASPVTAAAPTELPHAEQIRIALIGGTDLTNVWAYFDERGADYNNRAVQAGMWPGLYTLPPLTQTPELLLAEAPFSPFEMIATDLVSTVSLRPGLLWSDGSPLSAQDVAFTVNTALQFRLGLDWEAAYDHTIIDHVEALDATTVRFHFKIQPSIADWQYGALQGPVVSAAFWEPRLAAVQEILDPVPAIDEELLKLRIENAKLQNEMNDLLYELSLLDVTTQAAVNKRIEIARKQEEINSLGARIDEKQEQQESVFAAAREALYSLDASGEPIFGPFTPGARRDGEIVNDANPAYPFVLPNYDRVVYRVLDDEQAAVAALQNGEVDIILKPDGVTNPEEQSFFEAGNPPAFLRNRRSDIRYLALNLARPSLSDVYLRQAIACVAGAPFFQTTVFDLEGWVLPENVFWYAADVHLPCAGMDAHARQAEAVRLLGAAGYAWETRPVWMDAPAPGSGLMRGSEKLPPLTILVADDDPLRVSNALSISEQLRFLGMEVGVERVMAGDVLFRVYETQQYDMALLGWRLARYPGYLCDWFEAGNPYSYANADIEQHCAFFRAATDLEIARQEAFAIQSILVADLPAIPLYSDPVFDVMRGVTYPFEAALDGVSGMYGAPWLAVPAP